MTDAPAHTIRQRLRDHRRARERSREAEARSLAQIAAALTEGQQHGLAIKERAGLAGISRQTAYSLLERHGSAVRP